MSVMRQFLQSKKLVNTFLVDGFEFVMYTA